MNKKALSGVITSIMIIAMSIVLISTLWITVMTIINSPQLSPEEAFSCLDIQTKKIISIERAYIEEDQIKITLKRNTEAKEIYSIKFNLKGEENIQYSCSKDCPNCQILEKGKTQTYYFQNENNPSKVSIIVNNCNEIELKNILNAEN